MICRAIEEGGHKAIDGVPHHGKIVALPTDILQWKPGKRACGRENQRLGYAQLGVQTRGRAIDNDVQY